MSLPKWIEEKRMGHSIVRNSEWDKLIVEALTIAVEALENINLESANYETKKYCCDALRRIEELGK